MQSGRCVMWSGVAVAVQAISASADTIQVQSSRDNTLFQSATGSVSNGAGPYFFVGATGTPELRRGLLRFDLAGLVPPGSTITSVQLRLNMSRTISLNTDISLHRALKDWGEGASNSGLAHPGMGAAAQPGDATWLHRFFDQTFWSAPGGTGEGTAPDYVSAASGVATVGNALGPYTWSSAPGMVADVQAWSDNPAANFGWFLIGDELGGGNAKRFDTRENDTPANRPLLEVIFTPATCYANCDGSTIVPVLNVNDFTCFLNRYAAAQSYANCDASTIAPVLNVNDFTCFLNRYAAGCP